MPSKSVSAPRAQAQELKIQPVNYYGVKVGDRIYNKVVEWSCVYLGTATIDGEFRLVAEADDGTLITSIPSHFDFLANVQNEEFPIYYDAQGREHGEF